ncbi:MAG: alpha/beta fold hydrolase [Solirubrobacteraceae bacterium]
MKFTEIDGLRVRHLVQGSGPTVLVLHGWGASIETVVAIVNGLSPVAQVHALDLPGFGQSDPPPRPWGVDDYRDFVIRFLDVVGIEQVAVVGHSNGGRVAISLAAAERDRPAQARRISRLLLVDSAGIRPKRTFTWYRKVAMAKVGKHAARLLGAPGERLRDALVGAAASSDYAAAPPTMRPTLVRLVNADLRAIMPHIAVPTLLVWGSQDDATPLADAKLIERLIPDAGLVVFEGAGHYSYLDQPARFATIARHFLVEQAADRDRPGAAV